MSYRIVVPFEHNCPLCGKAAYLEESDDLGEIRYGVWCIGKGCQNNTVSRYSRDKKKAVRDFMGGDYSVGTP